MKLPTPIRVASQKTASPDARTYCTFRVLGNLFGFEASTVKEITIVPPSTPIPHAPDAACGYVNLRGQIVLVLDSQVMLHGERSIIGPDSRLIVFRARLGDSFGLLVESIGDIVELSDERVEMRKNGASSREESDYSPANAELIVGIGKLERELLTVLDAHKLLPRLESVIEQERKKAYH
jgi:purine-binding chemotaxis protein CheW